MKPVSNPRVHCGKCGQQFWGTKESKSYLKHIAKPHEQCPKCGQWFTKLKRHLANETCYV